MVKKLGADEINSEFCVLEVVDVLRRTAKLAETQNRPEVMMDVVAGWFELHERFANAEGYDDRGSKFGFCSTEELESAVSEHEHAPFVDESEDEDG